MIQIKIWIYSINLYIFILRYHEGLIANSLQFRIMQKCLKSSKYYKLLDFKKIWGYNIYCDTVWDDLQVQEFTRFKNLLIAAVLHFGMIYKYWNLLHLMFLTFVITYFSCFQHLWLHVFHVKHIYIVKKIIQPDYSLRLYVFETHLHITHSHLWFVKKLLHDSFGIWYWNWQHH